MITPQCSVCIRNLNNFKGDFMLVRFNQNNNDTNQNNNDTNQNILENQNIDLKWACQIHYPIMFTYKNNTWSQAKILLEKNNNIKVFYA